MRQLPQFRARHRERGISLMFVVVAIFALLGVSALAIDLVTLYVAKAEAQRVADSAALAAAKALIDQGVTADPANAQNNWSDACDQATAQAQGIAGQGRIGGSAPNTVTLTFGSGGAFGPCPSTGAAGSGFGVNPQAAVTVQSVALPLFFAKIWGQRTSTVSATSLAEGFNPSGTNVPVAAKCIAPWIMANIDPSTGGGPSGNPIINTSNGQMLNPGPTGTLNQDFGLQVGCNPSSCGVLTAPVLSGGGFKRVTYYPADLGTPAASGPSCALASNYENNLASCNPMPITCGDQIPIDNTIYPDGAAGPNTNALKCLTNANAPGLGQGQDTLNTISFPFIMHAGAENPLVPSALSPGDVISSSRSVVNIPIYASAPGVVPTSPVTVIGFAQAFVESVSANGRPRIRVLNVSGCQLPRTGTPVGTNSASSVPVRLIHP